MDLVNRFGGDFLGRRVVAAEKYWRDPLKWNREAERLGLRKRVFCASLADVFEDWNGHIHDSKGQVVWNECAGVTLDMQEVRDRLFDLIDETPNLDWLLLTKRPENILGMWPKMYSPGKVHMRHRKNVWLGTTVENQEQAGKRIPELLNCRELSPVLFLSCEPLLGPVDLSSIGGSPSSHPYTKVLESKQINWVIVGGESGKEARPMHHVWAESLRDQCQAANVPFFFKQWGEWQAGSSFDRNRDGVLLTNGKLVYPDSIEGRERMNREVGLEWNRFHPTAVAKVGKKRTGRLLDGREWSQFPLVKE